LPSKLCISAIFSISEEIHGNLYPSGSEITVSVRGKDSSTTRNKALDKIAEMLGSGELTTELPNGLSTEQLILTEVPVG